MGFPGDILSATPPAKGRHDRPSRVAPRGRLQWVPIRSLTQHHRRRITDHLLALPPADRHSRFGHAASEAQIDRYVQGIDFARDEVFGIFDGNLALVAVAHLAYERPRQVASRPAMVEFGVSVLPHVRGRGYGTRLFEHAVMHARNRGIARLFVHALSENAAMLHIARKAGARVERDGSESQGWLELPPDTMLSRLGQLVDNRASELDYRFKRHAYRLECLLEAVGEVREQLGRTRHLALE